MRSRRPRTSPSLAPALGLPLACVLGATACGGDTEYTVRAEARAGAAALRCGESYTGMGSSSGSLTLRDFRVYLSDIRLLGPGGEEAPLELDSDNPFQHEGVALLDFEDGSADCSETGNAELNRALVGTSELEEVTGIRFRVGVPFELNHLPTDTQPSPLNLGAMYWNWRGGYKFIRLDLRDRGASDPNDFYIHLGSTGCEAPTSVNPPAGPCARPNLPEVALDGFDPDTRTLVFDLAGLLTGVDTSTNAPMTAPGCMSAPDDPECAPLFPNLGLSVSTGACEVAGCAGQRFVRVE